MYRRLLAFHDLQNAFVFCTRLHSLRWRLVSMSSTAYFQWFVPYPGYFSKIKKWPHARVYTCRLRGTPSPFVVRLPPDVQAYLLWTSIVFKRFLPYLFLHRFRFPWKDVGYIWACVPLPNDDNRPVKRRSAFECFLVDYGHYSSLLTEPPARNIKKMLLSNGVSYLNGLGWLCCDKNIFQMNKRM